MILRQLGSILQDRRLSPEDLAKLSGGDFSNMTVRRALSGKDIHQLSAKAIAKTLKIKLDDLV